MKFKHIGLNMLLYAGYFIGSCFVTMLVEWLLMFIVDKFILLSYPVLTVLRIIIYTVGVIAMVAFIGYREGYREAVFSLSETALGGILATVIPHLLFAMLFHYQGFISGAVRYTAGLLYNGSHVTYDSLINNTPYIMFVAVFIVYGLLYTAALCIGKYYGAQKRVLDRAEMGVSHSD